MSAKKKVKKKRNPIFAGAVLDQLKNEILGKHYEFSLAFVNQNKIRSLNKKYRKKNEPTDILSFPLDKRSGEILICREMARKKSKSYGLKTDDYMLLLVIHGMLHLKGLNHGDKMRAYELSHYSRYRRGHL